MLADFNTTNGTPLLLPQNPRKKPLVVSFAEVNAAAHTAVHIRRITPDVCGILDQIAGAVAKKTGCNLETAYREAVCQLADGIAQSINCGAVLFDLQTDEPPSRPVEASKIIQLVA